MGNSQIIHFLRLEKCTHCRFDLYLWWKAENQWSYYFWQCWGSTFEYYTCKQWESETIRTFWWRYCQVVHDGCQCPSLSWFLWTLKKWWTEFLCILDRGCFSKKFPVRLGSILSQSRAFSTESNQSQSSVHVNIMVPGVTHPVVLCKY